MKKILCACALSCAFLVPAHAQQAAKPLHFVAGLGFTAGGDKLATTRYSDGTSANINAGGGVLFNVGLDYRISQQFSVEGTVGYHTDEAPQAKNGNASFHRMPLELLGYFHPNAKWRVGGGVRMAKDAKLSGNGYAGGLNESFDSSTGTIVEVEYFPSPIIGVKLRGVNEHFTSNYNRQDFSGNHIGVIGSIYF